MADVYYKLVTAGSRTIDQVPETLRADVQTKIDAATAAQAVQEAVQA
jgi:hypothetical protein